MIPTTSPPLRADSQDMGLTVSISGLNSSMEGAAGQSSLSEYD